ncbi:LPS export ABC transporter periplasmic protein LptC [Dysgonomonas massiliensis]|uniref:LPS export ABC transporter periplasmic protein LptC n=1 Tax=Dysgonomonas massiliensis TaxID=2040292 RepID=UPI000C77D077|nr:LPS export ABC transporter periplasmic protein LptC [Dysgonomonas massiliensis]
MSDIRHNIISRITVMTLLVITVFSLVSCGNNQKSDIDFAYDPELIPSMSTDSIDMIITSDSGQVKYRILTQTWNMYDNAKEPYWSFPDKLHVEQYDSLMQVEATIDADSAWNYVNKKLWKLKGKVVIKNTLGETFKTEELYWDQRTERIYSNVHVEVHRPDKITLHGKNGFESNKNMTEYSFFNVDAVLTVEDKNEPSE